MPLSMSPPEHDPRSAVGELGPHGHPGSFPDSPWCLSCRLGVAAQQQSQPCLQRTPQASRCTIPHVHLFSTVPYLLNVTVVHPGGANSSLLAFVAERISKCLSSLPLSKISQMTRTLHKSLDKLCMPSFYSPVLDLPGHAACPCIYRV